MVEGVGGFRVPLGAAGDTADLAALTGYPVLLVVGLRLGCINHALLSAEAIAARGLRLTGWVGSHVDPEFQRPGENLAALEEGLASPPLAVLPWDPDAGAARIAGQLGDLVSALMPPQAQ